MEVFANMRRGIKWSVRVLENGLVPFCPWLDYQLILTGDSDLSKVEQMYHYSMEFLRRSDIVFVTPDWEKSKGTKAEIVEAIKLGIPIVYSLDDLLEWKRKEEGHVQKHHRLSRFFGGGRHVHVGDEKVSNISTVTRVQHLAWHTLFSGDMTPKQICEIVSDVWIDPRYRVYAEKKGVSHDKGKTKDR